MYAHDRKSDWLEVATAIAVVTTLLASVVAFFIGGVNAAIGALLVVSVVWIAIAAAVAVGGVFLILAMLVFSIVGL